MTAPEELDHEAGARFIEKLMTEDPARLDVATDEQVDAMMAAAGIEAAEPESVQAVLARGERRARERAARGQGRANREAKAATKKATSRVAWAAGALVAAAAAAVIAVEIGDGSRRGPEAIGPDRPGPAPTPLEQARRLREDGLVACGAQDWTACGTKLDEAKQLDPAGESDPRVIEARRIMAPPVVPTTVPTTDLKTDPKGPLKPQ